MKILVLTSTDEDFQTHQKLLIDGKNQLTVGPCEPEDAIIGRDLVSCEDVARFMKMAVHAITAGDSVEFAEETISWEDF
jgi:hypothetical protein